jgi:hypothetical protein
MPLLSNFKYEAFAQAFVRHGSQAKAAIEAGYSARSSHVQGSLLMDRPEIVARIEELRAKNAKALAKPSTVVTRDLLLTHTLEVLEDPKGKASDKLRAVEVAGKLAGLWIDKTETEVTNKNPLATVSPDAMAALAAFAQARLAQLLAHQPEPEAKPEPVVLEAAVVKEAADDE